LDKKCESRFQKKLKKKNLWNSKKKTFLFSKTYFSVINMSNIFSVELISNFWVQKATFIANYVFRKFFDKNKTSVEIKNMFFYKN
jgi:hypothetical protein